MNRVHLQCLVEIYDASSHFCHNSLWVKSMILFHLAEESHIGYMEIIVSVYVIWTLTISFPSPCSFASKKTSPWLVGTIQLQSKQLFSHCIYLWRSVLPIPPPIFYFTSLRAWYSFSVFFSSQSRKRNHFTLQILWAWHAVVHTNLLSKIYFPSSHMTIILKKKE